MTKDLFHYKILKFKKGMASVLLDEAMPVECLVQHCLTSGYAGVAWTQTFSDSFLNRYTDKQAIAYVKSSMKQFMKGKKTELLCAIWFELSPEKMRLHFHGWVYSAKMNLTKNFIQQFRNTGHQLLKSIADLKEWTAYCDKSCDKNKPIFDRRSAFTMGSYCVAFAENSARKNIDIGEEAPSSTLNTGEAEQNIDTV